MTKTNFVLILTLSILLVFFIVSPLGADHTIIWCCLGIFYYNFINAFSKPIELRKGIYSYLKIDVLFLLFYYLLFFYPYQMYVLGMSDIKTNVFLYETYWMYSNKAILASTIGLLAFMWGFNKNFSNEINISKFYKQLNYNKLYLILLLLLILLIYLFFKNGLTEYIGGVYEGSDTGDSTDGGIYTLLATIMSIISALTIIYISVYPKNNIKFLMVAFSLICLAFLILLLIAGDRNTFFMLATIIICGIFTYFKNIGRPQIFILFFLALFLYQVIEISRKAENRSLTTIIDVISGDFDNHTKSQIGADVDQGSFSITTIVTRSAFKFVPEKADYFYGKFKLIGLAGFFPYLRGVIIDKKDRDISSSRFLTRSMDSPYGLGTSIIADTYLDFGISGVIFFMYLLGLIAGYIKFKTLSNKDSLKWGVIYLITVGTYSELARYSFDFIIKSIFWAFFMFFVFEVLSNARSKKLLPQYKKL